MAVLSFQLQQITMAIVCRCFRVQRAIAHRLAVDSLSSNPRNDGMQKGHAGTSQTSEKKYREKYRWKDCGIHFGADDALRKFKHYYQCDQILELLVRVRREVACARPSVAPSTAASRLGGHRLRPMTKGYADISWLT
jgi:hypothetical protein